ncbi:MAG TPA: hypothetical protein VFX61_13525 [Micromonosporaceae bacterium]|nr:hypothetical protein [Micromonosporaceae bacterium]
MNTPQTSPGSVATQRRPIHYITFIAVCVALYYLVPLVDRLYPPEAKIGLVLLVLVNALVVLILTAVYSAMTRPAWPFPLLAAVLFIPSIYIYYNDSALIYAVFYLIVGAVGLGIGLAIRASRQRQGSPGR